MHTFTKLREMIESHKDLKRKLEAIKRLIEPEVKPKRKIGFYVANEEIENLKNFKGIRFYDE